MGLSKRIALLVVGTLLGAVCVLPAGAQVRRDHGIYLDAKERVHIVQERGEVTIYLLRKERAAGGPEVFHNVTERDLATGEVENEPVIRFQDTIPLMRMRSEVLVAAPPNYLQNPGQRYRISVEGLELAPDYTHVFEVDAEDALAAFFNEAERMYRSVRAHGISEDAVYYGVFICANELNKTGYLPAQIPAAVLRSRVGRFRIEEGTLGRRSVQRLQRFRDVREGGGFKNVMEDETALSKALSRESLGGLRNRGTERQIDSQGQRPTIAETFDRNQLRPRDPRESRMLGLGSVDLENSAPGQATRPLTQPSVDLPPTAAASIDKYRVLFGDALSPIGLKGAQGPGLKPLPMRPTAPKDTGERPARAGRPEPPQYPRSPTRR